MPGDRNHAATEDVENEPRNGRVCPILVETLSSISAGDNSWKSHDTLQKCDILHLTWRICDRIVDVDDYN